MDLNLKEWLVYIFIVILASILLSILLLTTIGVSTLVPISTFVSLITASSGGWLALREYRLKVEAEIRLKESAEVEADIKLIKLFTEIMNIAHARGEGYVSEKAIEILLSTEILDTSAFLFLKSMVLYKMQRSTYRLVQQLKMLLSVQFGYWEINMKCLNPLR